MNCFMQSMTSRVYLHLINRKNKKKMIIINEYRYEDKNVIPTYLPTYIHKSFM